MSARTAVDSFRAKTSNSLEPLRLRNEVGALLEASSSTNLASNVHATYRHPLGRFERTSVYFANPFERPAYLLPEPGPHRANHRRTAVVFPLRRRQYQLLFQLGNAPHQRPHLKNQPDV